MFYSKEKINEFRSYDIHKVGEAIGIFKDESDYLGLCPIHELKDKTKAHNPSLNYNRKTNKCRCFICSKSFDTIDLVANAYNLNFIDACERIDNIINGKFIENSSIVIKKVEKKETITEEDKEEKYEHALRNSTSMSRFHGAKTNGSNMGNNFLLDKYLNSRAINYEKIKPYLEANDIEIRHCYLSFWKHMTTKNDYGEIVDEWYELDGRKITKEQWKDRKYLRFLEKFDNYICFFNLNHHMAVRRNIENFNSGKVIKKEDRYRNVAEGKYFKIDNKAKKTIVFEGFIDCLSFMSSIKPKQISEFNYISLNSTNTIDIYLEHENYGEDEKVFLLLDNDDAGNKGVLKIQEHFKQAKDLRYLFKDFNDVNDYLVAGNKFPL